MVESVDLLVSATGNVLRSEIVGAVKMRVYLSGMPELRLGKSIGPAKILSLFHI